MPLPIVFISGGCSLLHLDKQCTLVPRKHSHRAVGCGRSTVSWGRLGPEAIDAVSQAIAVLPGFVVANRDQAVYGFRPPAPCFVRAPLIAASRHALYHVPDRSSYDQQSTMLGLSFISLESTEAQS